MIAHSDRAVEYSDCISATGVLDVTQKNLLVRF